MEQNNDKDKYDLYTEHIVPNTDRKAKRFITKCVNVLVFGAIFGLIAGLVMIIIYQKGREFFVEEPSESITLGDNNASSSNSDDDDDIKVSVPDEPSQESTTDIVIEWNEELESQIKDINAGYEAMKAIASKVNSYSVTVKKKSDTIVGTGLYNTSETFGIVVAEGPEHYYILTDDSFINSGTAYVVEYQTGDRVDAELVASDATTGFAIVRTLKEGLKNVSIATLGSSKNVVMGDIVVAVGELYGFVDSMGYGMVTGANVTVSDTDSEFKIITTDIVGSASSFGVIANTMGDITGIITTNYNTGTSNHIVAYAVDDVTGIIEKLMNGVKCSYLGIRGLAVAYDKDSKGKDMMGIYVSSIEIDSPAYFAGVQPGDIITSIENKKTTTMDEFMDVLYSKTEDSNVELKIKRKGREQYKEIVFQVTLGVE